MGSAVHLVWVQHPTDCTPTAQPPEEINQPTNNDLGFFCSLESIYMREAPKDFHGIIKCVIDAYWNYDRVKLNRLFLSRMQVMNCIIENHGDNQFKLTHINKRKLE